MTMMSGSGGGGGVMGAGNPVVGGTTLRIPAIQSPNYVHGVSGWAVFADGTAEFAGLTIDGGTLVMGGSGEVLLYTGTPAAGNLFAVMAPVAGTDAFANSWPAGITLFGADGSQLSQQVQANRAMMKVTPPTQAGITWTPGLVEGFYGAPYPAAPVQASRGALALIAPVDAGGGDGAGLTIFGGVATATGSQVLQQSDTWWVLADTFNLAPKVAAAVAAVISGTLQVDSLSTDGGSTFVKIRSNRTSVTTNASGDASIATGLTSITNVVAWNGDSVARSDLVVGRNPTTTGGTFNVRVHNGATNTAFAGTMTVEWIALGS